jgi:predicted anti-sigma-YlaC factor YlaD
MPQTSHLCERARSWASLRTDGELSELESALLDAHLERCDACRAFAQGTEAVALAIRSAEPQTMAPLALVLRRARHTGLRALQVAAAVVVVVSAGIVAAVTGPSGNARAVKPVAMVAGVDSPDRLRELRRPALVGQGRAVPKNRLMPGEAV